LKELKGSQKKYLRGLAHNLNPSAFIGQKGLTEALIEEIDNALEAAELIKVKFNDFKDKESKNALSQKIATATQSYIAGMIGHVVVLYRPNKNSEKQKIQLS
jgi:RNA-binding protein